MVRKKKDRPLNSDEILVTLTNSYRIFGSSSFLDQRSRNVNYVFNHMNATAYDHLRKYSVWLSKDDLQSMTAGISKLRDADFGFSFRMHSQTAQAISHAIYDGRKWTPNKAAKAVLNFRTKKDKGWIPFYPRSEDITMPDKKRGYGHIRFLGRLLKFKAQRPLPLTSRICQSDFVQDNKGNWYVNITYEYVEKVKKRLDKAVGIDLNLGEEKQIVLSDGRAIGRINLTKEKEKITNRVHKKIYDLKYDDEQQDLLSRKKALNTLIYGYSSTATDEEKSEFKKEVKSIKETLSAVWKEKLKAIPPKEKAQKLHALSRLYRRLSKIEYRFKNKRKDYQHKISRTIADHYDEVYFGDGLKSGLSQTKMARSFQDIAPGKLRKLTNYKVSNNGYHCDVKVSEAGTTFSCNRCLEPTGPKGTEGLSIREWRCPNCGERHDRDVNAAKNILDLGQGSLEYDHKLKKMNLKVSSGTATLANL